MNCTSPESKPDWNAYAFGELKAEERRQAEAHAAACEACRDELSTLRLTLDAMSTLREEEIPRRIAFVSDKVFEPKWWQKLFTPTFAGAAVLSCAILVHAFVRPVHDDQIDKQVQAKIEAQVDKVMEQLQEVQALEDADYRARRQDQSNVYVATANLVYGGKR